MMMTACGGLPAPISVSGVIVSDDPIARVTWFRPDNPAEGRPALVLIHGFFRNRGNMEGHARALAERGWTVLTPDIRYPLTNGKEARWKNVEVVVAFLQDLDRTHGRLALAGHSAGGALAVEAAAEAQEQGIELSALVLLDAVPWEATLDAAARLKPLPLLSITSPPCANNLYGKIERLHAAIPFPFARINLPGTSHLDPENPPRIAGRMFGTQKGREDYARLLVAFLTGDRLDIAASSGL